MDISEAIEEAARLIGEKAQWAIFGAVAANLYRAEPRSTFDIDILITISNQDLCQIKNAAFERGWQTKSAKGADWLLRITHQDYGSIDMIAVEDEYEKSAIERSRWVDLHGKPIRVLQPEDVIIHKLIAHRSRDDADIISILESEPALDWAYIEQWVEHWDLQSKLAFVEARFENEFDRPLRKVQIR